MLIRRIPASQMAWACSASRTPLVVRLMSFIPGISGQFRDKRDHALTRQGLSAGQADLFDAQADA